MSRIDPVPREDLPDLAPVFGAYEQIMGFVPNTVVTMARVPGLVEGYAGLALAAAMNGLIPESLAQMVANVTSAAGGCRYCQAHTAAHAAKLGVEAEKLGELWSFETSDRFDDAERAALRLAPARGPVAERGDRRGLRGVPARTTPTSRSPRSWRCARCSGS